MRQTFFTSIFIFLLGLAPASAFASGGVLLAKNLDTECVKTAAANRDRATDDAYSDFRIATNTARDTRQDALKSAGRDKNKIKTAQQNYRDAISKANKDLSTSKKNVNSMLKAQIDLCKK